LTERDKRDIASVMGGGRNAGGQSALVIDDDRTLRNAIVSILKESLVFKEIESAGNGLEGWRILQQKAFNVVLIDWMMPVMDGYNFVKTVRRDRNRHKTKIIMVTSKKQVGDVSDAMNAGITSYLIKPFEKEALIRKVKTVMESPRISPKETEYLEEAEKYYKEENLGKALHYFSAALDVVPANMATKLRLVETYTRKLEYDRAYLTLSEMLKDEVPEEILKPSSSAMVKLGDVDMEKGNLTESAMKYREALAADPAQLEGHIGLGEVELKRGNHESAGKHFDMAKNIALDVNEDDITMLNNIAIRHRRSGRPKEAVAILERSL